MTVTTRRLIFARGTASAPSVAVPAAAVTDSLPPVDTDGSTPVRTDGGRPVSSALADTEAER